MSSCECVNVCVHGSAAGEFLCAYVCVCVYGSAASGFLCAYVCVCVYGSAVREFVRTRGIELTTPHLEGLADDEAKVAAGGDAECSGKAG